MAKKPNKRKYTRRSQTPTQRITVLEYDNQHLQNKVIELSKELSYKEQQRQRLAETLDNCWAKIAELRERNITLIEAVEILARTSRLSKQSKQLQYKSANEMIATPLMPKVPAGSMFQTESEQAYERKK